MDLLGSRGRGCSLEHPSVGHLRSKTNSLSLSPSLALTFCLALRMQARIRGTIRRRNKFTPQSDHVVGQSLEAWPIFAASGTLATKPVSRGESSPSILQASFGENRPVVFSHRVSGSETANRPNHDRSTDEVSVARERGRFIEFELRA